MIKSSYRYLLYILFGTFLFSAEYQTLYLMEFENSSSDYRIDYLRKYFPELISNTYQMPLTLMLWIVTTGCLLYTSPSPRD